MGDDHGVAQALKGQLEIVNDNAQRVALLRELGQHYSQRMNDDDQAEECWKNILTLDPSDLETRHELTELHRRRGNFDALDSALMRQIWITSDVARAAELCRTAADNLDQNFGDAERSITGWRRVLDLVPRDLPALGALARHYTALDNKRELVAVLEQQIRAVDDSDQRVALAMHAAGLWEAEGRSKSRRSNVRARIDLEANSSRRPGCSRPNLHYIQPAAASHRRVGARSYRTPTTTTGVLARTHLQAATTGRPFRSVLLPAANTPPRRRPRRRPPEVATRGRNRGAME